MSLKSSQKIRTILVVLGIVAVFVFFATKANRSVAAPLNGKTVVIYRSATCGCCQQYISYLKKNGLAVEEKIIDGDDSELASIKDQFKVPEKIRSCHTMRLDGYTIEGHVPVEAIQKLLADKPDFAGIALPGMPAGSPGMPGVKFGKFDIASFTSTGLFFPYLSL